MGTLRSALSIGGLPEYSLHEHAFDGYVLVARAGATGERRRLLTWDSRRVVRLRRAARRRSSPLPQPNANGHQREDGARPPQ